MNEPAETGSRLPPGFFVRSFSIIIIGYLGFYACLLLIGIGVGMLIEGDAFRQAFDNENFDPNQPPKFEQLFSKSSAWLMLGLNTVSAIGCGYLVARLARFARFGHGLFLAAAFFITFLQVLFNDEPFAPAWLTIALLGFIPTATLFGAKYCEINQIKKSLANKTVVDP